jgi:hypothetical protein
MQPKEMETNHQTEIFQAMAKGEFYPHAVAVVEQRETHISKSALNPEDIRDEKSILI